MDDNELASEVGEMLQKLIGRPPRISPSFFLLPNTKYNYGPRESQRLEQNLVTVAVCDAPAPDKPSLT
jgi:hypothetical protein